MAESATSHDNQDNHHYRVQSPQENFHPQQNRHFPEASIKSRSIVA